jgi:hypothetical protein
MLWPIELPGYQLAQGCGVCRIWRAPAGEHPVTSASQTWKRVNRGMHVTLGKQVSNSLTACACVKPVKGYRNM